MEQNKLNNKLFKKACKYIVHEKKNKGANMECPFNYVVGKNFNKFIDCKKCEKSLSSYYVRCKEVSENNDCPHGLIFGYDFGTCCDACYKYDRCKEAYELNKINKEESMKDVNDIEEIKTIEDLLPEVQIKIKNELIEKATKIVMSMEKEIKATEIVLEKMYKKRDTFLKKSIDELLFEPKKYVTHNSIVAEIIEED